MRNARRVARRITAAAACCALATLTLSPSAAAPGQTRKVTNAWDTGRDADGPSWHTELSADGRYVAFVSFACNLVPNDTNGPCIGFKGEDAFVHDRVTGVTERVSVDSQGGETPGRYLTTRVDISDDGRYAVFDSEYPHLAPGNLSGEGDVYLHDRVTRETRRVSVNSSGEAPLDDGAHYGQISGDGRIVAFVSGATNLVPGKTNQCDGGLCADVFIHDLLTATTSRVSVSTDGRQGDGHSYDPQLSSDGRFVAFGSQASTLVPEDDNWVCDPYRTDQEIRNCTDIFVHDRQTGVTELISVSTEGERANNDSFRHAISADGRYVAFSSDATNLAPRDRNKATDVFVRDRLLGTTTRVSLDSCGREGNRASDAYAISADGRLILFGTSATNFYPDRTDWLVDVVLRDRDIDGNGVFDEVGKVATYMVGVSSSGEFANAYTEQGAMASAARVIAFDTFANNLVEGDRNGDFDVFVHELGPPPRLRMQGPVSGPVRDVGVATEWVNPLLLQSNCQYVDPLGL